MVRAIAEAIVNGEWLPGARLDEHGLAARFEVSRTPVREALSQLAAMGLVERRPNRGAVVASIGDDRLVSMFETMGALEAACARLAAERMTVVERARLEEAHLASANHVRTSAVDAYEAHNARFHDRICEGAHNGYLAELAMLTRARLAPFRRALFAHPERLSQSYEEHDAIVTAILRADAPGAEAAMRAHLAVFDRRPDTAQRPADAVRIAPRPVP
ncbi:GntR family transcriptional regulator [Pelagibacterium xiamenense]|uniref:GntR family transcriptional regulator n=1 Tax=Pelagibacterium xiamenense TaxID=2901140 RepID=UPI001E3C35DA|nr:GntR family transcriptional regulator [Pelagibacterium xiamenense]MCD7060663.1 GntR family transcriptional regulator [Pelagibacterium xiamenense]